jgi:hypothetical protein
VKVRGAVAVRTPLGYLVAACDGLAAIGAMPADAVTAPWPVVGAFTARVALMELMALGAEPRLLTVTASLAPADVVAGAVREAGRAGLGEGDVAWSAEHNVDPAQTAVGVTAVGIAPVLRLARAGPGLAAVALGRPKVGRDVRLDDPEIADLPALRRVLACPAAVAVSPAGSGGLAARARALADEAGMRFAPGAPPGWDVTASAGPATSLVCVTADPEAIRTAFRGPAAVIGRFLPC